MMMSANKALFGSESRTGKLLTLFSVPGQMEIILLFPHWPMVGSPSVTGIRKGIKM